MDIDSENTNLRRSSRKRKEISYKDLGTEDPILDPPPSIPTPSKRVSKPLHAPKPTPSRDASESPFPKSDKKNPSVSRSSREGRLQALTGTDEIARQKLRERFDKWKDTLV